MGVLLPTSSLFFHPPGNQYDLSVWWHVDTEAKHIASRSNCVQCARYVSCLINRIIVALLSHRKPWPVWERPQRNRPTGRDPDVGPTGYVAQIVTAASSEVKIYGFSLQLILHWAFQSVIPDFTVGMHGGFVLEIRLLITDITNSSAKSFLMVYAVHRVLLLHGCLKKTLRLLHIEMGVADL
jgi:hypothetical protein